MIPAAATSGQPRVASIRSTPSRTRPSLRTDVEALLSSGAREGTVAVREGIGLHVVEERIDESERELVLVLRVRELRIHVADLTRAA